MPIPAPAPADFPIWEDEDEDESVGDGDGVDVDVGVDIDFEIEEGMNVECELRKDCGFVPWFAGNDVVLIKVLKVELDAPTVAGRKKRPLEAQHCSESRTPQHQRPSTAHGDNFAVEFIV